MFVLLAPPAPSSPSFCPTKSSPNSALALPRRRTLPRWPPFRTSSSATPPGQPRAWPRSDNLRDDNFRGRILKRDRHRCFYCRQPLLPGDWTLDHVVPIARGGSDLACNLVACCARCNWAKGHSPAADYLRLLRRKGALTPAQLRSRLKALSSLGQVTVLRPAEDG